MSLNPITTLLPLNGSLEGRDRSGAFSAVGSGALRWQPADGARVNYVLNPVLANGIANVNAVRTTIAHETTKQILGRNSVKVTITDDSSGYQGCNFVCGGGSFGAFLNGTFSASAVVYHEQPGSLDFVVGYSATTVTVQPNTPTVVTGLTNARLGASVNQFLEVRRSGVASIGEVFWVTLAHIETGATVGSPVIGGDNGAVWLDPLTGQLGTPHASPSVSRAVAWVEEGTTNLVPNPWRAVDNAGWSALNGSTARSTSYAYQGSAAGLLTASAANAEEKIDITAAASGHTAQAIVLNLAAASRQCQLTYNGSLIGSPTNVAAGASATITAPFTGTGSAAALGVRWIDGANTETFVTYYLGAEAKTYATSPCPAIDASGNLLTGYAWTGTAHASESTRAVCDVIFDYTNRILPAQGSLLSRFSILIDVPSDNQSVVSVGGAGFYNNRTFIYKRGSDSLVAALGDTAVTLEDLTPVAVGPSITAEVSWDGSQGRLYRNGSLVDGPDAYNALSAYSGNVVIGRNVARTGSSLDGLIGPVAIYDAPLSDARRAMVNAAIDANATQDELWGLFAGNPYTFFQLRPY